MAGGLDRAAFYESGRQSVRDIEAVLAVMGRSMSSYRRIYDFGCGCGRILLWLGHLSETSEVYGSDIDARAVRWAQEQFPWAQLSVNQPLPPLEHPDASFDLVYNHSVFTHIDEQYQDLWLAELRRVTKPGANLLLSVHGENAFFEYEAASRNAGGNPQLVRDQLASEGIAFIREDPWVG
ncbi:MAG: class I SAM-dependent methyltransferase, partial [Acidimicrobiales bacterium]